MPKSNLPTFHPKRRLDGRLDWTKNGLWANVMIQIYTNNIIYKKNNKSNLPIFRVFSPFAVPNLRKFGRLDWALAISSRSTSLSPVSLRHMACSWQSNLPSRPRYALRVVETISSLPKVSATRRQCRNVFSSHLSHSSHNHAPSAT